MAMRVRRFCCTLAAFISGMSSSRFRLQIIAFVMGICTEQRQQLQSETANVATIKLPTPISTEESRAQAHSWPARGTPTRTLPLLATKAPICLPWAVQELQESFMRDKASYHQCATVLGDIMRSIRQDQGHASATEQLKSASKNLAEEVVNL